MRAALTAMLLVLGLATSARAQDTTTTTEPEATTTTTVAETTTTAPTTTSLTLPITTTTFTVTTITVPPTTTLTVTTTTLPAAPAPERCIRGDDRSCDDGNPCTVDSCIGAFLTCVHHPLDGPPCPDDGVFCTADRCVAGVCRHLPSGIRCDRGECVVRACHPDDPNADRSGCVLLHGPNRHDGAPCTDDGFSCTEDVCNQGVCLHLPVDMDCVSQDVCSAAVCAPGHADRDAKGCVVGPPRDEGEACADDVDPCTTDVCRGGTCAHEPEADLAECSPVKPVFQRALALGNMADELGAEVTSLAPAGGPPPSALQVALDRLARVEADLDAAASALAGTPVAETPLVEHLARASLVARPAVTSTTSTSERARIAFTMMLRTPRQMSAFLQAVAQARANRALSRPAARHLRRHGRLLLRTTRALRADLRALQR